MSVWRRALWHEEMPSRVARENPRPRSCRVYLRVNRQQGLTVRVSWA